MCLSGRTCLAPETSDFAFLLLTDHASAVVIEAMTEREHGQTLLPPNLLRTVQFVCVCACVLAARKSTI